MKTIYSKPQRLYFIVIILTVLGLILSRFLPVTLYPNATKPSFRVRANLFGLTPDDFYNQYGRELRNLLGRTEGIEKVHVTGFPNSITFDVLFNWGIDTKKAKREIQLAVESFRPRLPKEIRENLWYYPVVGNTAYFAATIFSSDGDLSKLKKAVEPYIYYPIKSIDGIESVFLDNPDEKNIVITLHPEQSIYHKINPLRLIRYIESTLTPINPGNINLGEIQYQSLLQNQIGDFSQLEQLPLDSLGANGIKLGDIADIKLDKTKEASRIHKTNGQPSLILGASFSDNANLKAVCDQIVSILKTSKPFWPKGSDYKILVNPSELIKSAISDVYEAIVLGGLFAVAILFFFVGSLKLTIFSALEIPLAMAWAFILMYLNNVGINLISLGGLALSAGMNVDASVVVVENIIRHFEMPQNKNRYKLDVIVNAVNEVKWPLLTSTLTSLVVFLPLSFTSGLTYAILGDLAKTVVFSHLFSAIIAIVLVPTIRSQIHFDSLEINCLSKKFNFYYAKFVEKYQKFLSILLVSRQRCWAISFGIFLVVVGISYLLLPKIKKEIIARPSSELLVIEANVQGASTTQDVSDILEPYEKILKNEFQGPIDYTYTEIFNESFGNIVAHLTSKKLMTQVWHQIEKKFPNTPQVQFNIEPFNPSNLALPNPPNLSIKIMGPEAKRIEFAENLRLQLRSTRQFSWVQSTVFQKEQFTFKPHFPALESIAKIGGPTLSELGDIISLGLRKKVIGQIKYEDKFSDVLIQYSPKWFKTIEDLAALPILAGPYILPLKALASIKLEDVVSGFYMEDESHQTKVSGYLTQEALGDKVNNEKKFKAFVESLPKPDEVQVIVEDSEVEINKSLRDLLWAFLISLSLIAAIIYIQFESLRDVIIVLAAIPLGFLGVSLGLWIFNSTWSINSLLGVILLAGIAVNNSIILVSFYNQCRDEGLNKLEAAIRSAAIRMRPILITSLTTILAMVPLAMGLGSGGEILQPLGISVSFGMLFSTLLTLIVIPCLEVLLDFKNAK